jgi:predicted ATP-grasp superfamily ATP-dependent carboligase
MSVLILAADQKQAIPAVQSLGKRGIEVACLSPNPKAPAFYSKFCTEKIRIEDTSNREAYADFLKHLLKNGKYHMLMPCSDHSTVLVSEYRGLLSPYVKFFLPGHDIMLTVTNKTSLMKFAAAHRISVPRTYFPQNRSELEQLHFRLNHPVVIKGNTTAGAKYVKYASTKAELIRFFEQLYQNGVPPLVQDYIRGKEKLFYGLCDKGEVLAYFMMESVRAFPITGGTPAKAFSIFDPELKDFAFNIIQATKWTGMVSLDIKQERGSEKYYLLDFNPRFGATSFLALKSGVDFPYLLYKLAIEGKKEYVYSYTKKIYRSLFREDLFYAANRPLSIPKLLLEFLDPRVFYGFDRDDPAPYFRLAKNTLGDLKKSLLS